MLMAQCSDEGAARWLSSSVASTVLSQQQGPITQPRDMQPGRLEILKSAIDVNVGVSVNICISGLMLRWTGKMSRVFPCPPPTLSSLYDMISFIYP